MSPLPFSFTLGPTSKHSKGGIGAGGIAGIVVGVALLLVLIVIAIDYYCCYPKHFGCIFHCRQKFCGEGERAQAPKFDCKCSVFPSTLCNYDLMI